MSILEDENNPARSVYLRRFADWEGKRFLGRFWRRFEGHTADAALESLVRSLRRTPRRLAVIYRSVKPEADFEQFCRFPSAHSDVRSLSKGALLDLELYYGFGPKRYSPNDWAYLAGVHPLELWLLEYLQSHPNALLAEVEAASVRERQGVSMAVQERPEASAGPQNSDPARNGCVRRNS